MLIKCDVIKSLLDKHGISVKGVLHVGAHECEELGFYNNILNTNNIIWVDGNIDKVSEMQKKGIDNIYSAVISDEEKDIMFHITDNTQASSILELNHDEGYYNNIHIIRNISCRTERLPTFLQRIGKDASQYNFWNLDIQGSEFALLKGAVELLDRCDAIYTEVNSAHVYRECGLIDDIDALLKEHGFERAITQWTGMNWGDALYIRTV